MIGEKLNAERDWDIRIDPPMVSVCVQTYQHVDYIRNCLNGILMQKTNFPFEIILHDDASKDGTAEICREYVAKYPHIIRPFLQKKNQYSKGLNPFACLQIPRVRGKYIAICEGDDCWIDPDKLFKQVQFLEANEDYVLVATDINLIDSEGNPIPDNNMVVGQRKQRAGKEWICFFDLLKVNHINTLTACFRADAVRDNWNRTDSASMWFVHDYWHWLCISLRAKIKVWDLKTANYRVHEGGVSRDSSFCDSRKGNVLLDALTQFYCRYDKKISLSESKLIVLRTLSVVKRREIPLSSKIKLLGRLFLLPGFLMRNKR